jgi:hypothetical protein
LCGACAAIASRSAPANRGRNGYTILRESGKKYT